MELFHISTNPGRTTLNCHIKASKFDAATVMDFRNRIDMEWSPEIEQVVLDLKDVDFIDSSGVGALLALQKKIAPQGNPLTLVNANKQVVEVMELLRLHRVFNLNPGDS